MASMEHARKNAGGLRRRLPQWLKRPMGSGEKFAHVTEVLDKLHLTTVCSSAMCPNRGECYSRGTATFMIMGDVCTRNCEFCSVRHGSVAPLSDDEPVRVAQAVKQLRLKYVVITSVTRDDLPDGGAEHFARVIQALRKTAPDVIVEVLTPDFKGNRQLLDIVLKAHPDVFNHNIETTSRLTPQIRSGADYHRSLDVLKYIADSQNKPIVKSGFMLGLGETEQEITEMLTDMLQANVEMVTIGQYLRPGPDNREVQKFYRPEEFEDIKTTAEKMGFKHIAAGPFVRSSYHAEINFQTNN